MFDGAGAALDFGYDGPITTAPLLMPLLTLGPILLAAVVGLICGRARAIGGLAPALAGVAAGFGLLYFVRLPGGDMVWVGWRAGQILLLTMTPLAAMALARIFDLRRFRWLALSAVLLLFAVGLPTTLIDTFNAQDIGNRLMGPGFHWTVTVTADERKALDWIRRETPSDALVQMEPTVRGRETWTLIPSFAHRRMAAGLPISLLNKPIYDVRSQRVRTLYSTHDPQHAWKLAVLDGVDYLYVDATERRAFGRGVEKFDEHPKYFERVYRGGDVSVYRIVPESEQAGLGGAPEM
ncbi:MAG: hypothetical protein NTY02_16340 [Acidobacteria bacterium]|nr:hypothetical protein [Acidobacteriota bacterium]